MWCKSAVNRNFLSFPAAWRTRSSALGASFRLGVREAFCCGRFPLASPLPSIPSATGCPVLFGDFSGTTGLSDFPDPFVIGVRPWTSRRVPRRLRPWADLGSPGSHARCLPTCTGSLTARDSGTPRDIGVPDGAFRFSLRLNTRPARSPVNASTPPLRVTPHDSGPMWVATPLSYDFCIHYTSPVLTGAQGAEHD